MVVFGSLLAQVPKLWSWAYMCFCVMSSSRNLIFVLGLVMDLCFQFCLVCRLELWSSSCMCLLNYAKLKKARVDLGPTSGLHYCVPTLRLVLFCWAYICDLH